MQHAMVGALGSQAWKLVVADFWVTNWHPGS
jgi:hypothetical protein